jgi:hypothetical protein
VLKPFIRAGGIGFGIGSSAATVENTEKSDLTREAKNVAHGETLIGLLRGTFGRQPTVPNTGGKPAPTFGTGDLPTTSSVVEQLIFGPVAIPLLQGFDRFVGANTGKGAVVTVGGEITPNGPGAPVQGNGAAFTEPPKIN